MVLVLGLSKSPAVPYEENVVRKRIIERVFSPLQGPVIVEDVEIAVADSRGTVLRRRLRFECKPNLIQTEMPLVVSEPQKGSADYSKHRSYSSKFHPNSKKKTRVRSRFDEDGLRVDHSEFAHVYQASIVAGFRLIAPKLKLWKENGNLVRVLIIGTGGGALPGFLHTHFDFMLEGWEIDEVVLELAKRHFGLVASERLKLRACDGLSAIEDVANEAVKHGLVTEKNKLAWKKLFPESPVLSFFKNSDNCSLLCTEVETDPRFNIIIVDVDVDADESHLGFGSLPYSFLSKRFLLAACIALHDGGMLVLNVLPSEAVQYRAIIHALKEIFYELYEIECDNRIVFALPSYVHDINDFLPSDMQSCLDKSLVNQIWKV